MILYSASVSSSTSTLTSSDVGGRRACLLIQYTSLSAPPSLLAILPSCHPPCLPGVPTCLYGAAIDSVMLLAYQQLTSIISAPPIHPKQSCLHPVGAADPSNPS